MLDFALRSPLYQLLLVPQARRTMISTAEANGIDWSGARAWIADQQGPWSASPALAAEGQTTESPASVAIPEYYRQPFHAYEQGNLCWEAAWEQELASKAVGARNFPAYRERGEEAFRGAFDEALGSLGAEVPDGCTIVDLGCGTGISTRRLATQNPQAAQVIGVDLSPHMVAVGQRLLSAAPLGCPPWVSTIQPDPRAQLRLADAAQTRLPGGSAAVVALTLVAHELPPFAFRQLAAEAYRLLRPGGQLWISEMDFQTAGYKKLRGNVALYSLIRATEPYLDEYAAYQISGDLAADLVRAGFAPVKLTAATGRHFAAVATKPESGANSPSAGDVASMVAAGLIIDRRKETAKEDTHLLTWEEARGGEGGSVPAARAGAADRDAS